MSKSNVSKAQQDYNKGVKSGLQGKSENSNPHKDGVIGILLKMSTGAISNVRRARPRRQSKNMGERP